MDFKAWLKWAFIFLVLGSFSVYVFYPVETVPLASAYSYEDAKLKVDWNSVRNDTILIYTKEPTYLGNAVHGSEVVWAVWEPCQYEFKKFVNSKSFTSETWNEQGKTVYVFTETVDNQEIKWDTLDKNVLNAYGHLNKCMPKGANSKFGLMTPNHIS